LHARHEGRVAEVHGADIQPGDDIGQGLDEEASTVFQVGRFDAAAGNGETGIELKGGARYIAFVMIREFFECLAMIAQLVPFVAIIMSFFM